MINPAATAALVKVASAQYRVAAAYQLLAAENMAYAASENDHDGELNAAVIQAEHDVKNAREALDQAEAHFFQSC